MRTLLNPIVFFVLLGAARISVAQSSDSSSEIGRSLFTERNLPKLAIDISKTDVEVLRQHPREYVSITVTAGGNVYRKVGLHLKGSLGSFRTVDEKPSFTLDFGRFDSSLRFHGLTKIHLNNSVEDPAYVNEIIGSELFHAAGIPAPRVTRAQIEMNGKRLGFYVLKEAFDDDFLSVHFRKPDGALVPLCGNQITKGSGYSCSNRLI